MLNAPHPPLESAAQHPAQICSTLNFYRDALDRIATIAASKKQMFKIVPDRIPPTPPAPLSDAHTPTPRGYFDQAQLDDLETAESVLTAVQDHAANGKEAECGASG